MIGVIKNSCMFGVICSVFARANIFGLSRAVSRSKVRLAAPATSTRGIRLPLRLAMYARRHAISKRELACCPCCFNSTQARHWRPPPVRTLLSPRSRHRRAARGTRRRVLAANGEVRDAPLSSITLSSSSFATPLRPVVIPSRPPVSSLVAVADSERRAPPTPSGRVGASV